MSTETRNYLEAIRNQDEDGDGNNDKDEYEEDLELESQENDNDNGDEDRGNNNDKAGVQENEKVRGEGNDKHEGGTKGKDGDKNKSKVGGDQSGKDGDRRNSKNGGESSSKDGGENSSNDGGRNNDHDGGENNNSDGGRNNDHDGDENNNSDGGEGEDKDGDHARNDRNETGRSGAKEGATEEVKRGNVAKSEFLEFHNPSIDIALGMATQVLDELTGELISMFSDKVSRLEARRQFENRKWSSGESFGSYVDDKVMLGQRIDIDTEEMISRIIEGIPNQGLQNQAHIQCFENIAHIKRAFAEVKLPKYNGDKKDATKNKNEKDSKDTRCYNCNAKGHWAKECRKPRREKGSCYACGEMGHFVAKCLKNKVKSEVKSIYVRYREPNFVYQNI
nr:probable ATP-dependent helicase PF08_0048 [Drosophila bipectinata]XP_043069805.1 probable ATP-dependent helicase PF08_0048 [Drosophila bipectinata]